MPYAEAEKLDLYTMMDVCRATKTHPSYYYRHVEAGIFPAPTRKVVKRFYYNFKEYQEAVKKVEEFQALLKEGGVK